MALAEQEIQETTVQDGPAVQTTRRVESPVAAQEHKTNVAARVVWYIAGVILTLLAIRFLFALLGANAGNGFASFIYSVTKPLVSPFFGVFGYDYSSGVARFETYTLLAMAIYALIAYGISKLITINSRD